ncbi:reverse transcriptase domain-containing protein [Tanacetum coccineum]
MKLNPKKCSFGVDEGKFLGYMVTLEGIRANPKKTKAVTDMQSPKTLKEMQNLSRKLAALNCFLSRSAERALPFFETLKNITKENKDDYRWTEEAEQAFQELKKLIIKLPTLTTPEPKETLYVYLDTSCDVVLADFINKIPAGIKHLEVYSLTNEENTNEWILYTDGAPSLKGVGAGLVLIDPSGMEYTYAIRLTFDSTNNEAEYQALLVGLQKAYKIKIQALKVKVYSKLVACQMNSEFVENSEGMEKYLAKAKEHATLFKTFSIENIPRNQYQKEGVLRKFASVTFNHLIKEVLVEVFNTKSVDAQEVSIIVEETIG